MSDPRDQLDVTDSGAVGERLHEAIEGVDNSLIAEIVESISSQEALHQVSLLNSGDRDHLISALAPDTAAELIEEAPAGLAATMTGSLDSEVAAKIMAALHTDTQADIVNEINKNSADAILSAMDPQSAEEVRKLSQYHPDTAGGLMELEVFSFTSKETVGAVLTSYIVDVERHERRRAQHPYITDEAGTPFGVVSLSGLLRSKRSVLLVDVRLPSPSNRKPVKTNWSIYFMRTRFSACRSSTCKAY